MLATLMRADASACDSVLPDLPFRRTSLSLLFATGLFASWHSASAAVVDPTDGAGPLVGGRSSLSDPTDGVVTISLSEDDDIAGTVADPARAERMRRLEARKVARTARALRIASMRQAAQAATTSGKAALISQGSHDAQPVRPGRPLPRDEAWARASEPVAHVDASTLSVMPGSSMRSDTVRVTGVAARANGATAPLVVPPGALTAWAGVNAGTNAASPSFAVLPDRPATRARTIVGANAATQPAIASAQLPPARATRVGQKRDRALERASDLSYPPERNRMAEAVAYAIPGADTRRPDTNAPGVRKAVSPEALRTGPVALPPDLADAPASPAGTGWDVATRQAAVRMRARTLTAGVSKPAPLQADGGASLASAATGGVTLADMIDAERPARVFPRPLDHHLHLAGSAAMPWPRSQAASVAGWMAEPADSTADGTLSPQGDLRPVFLAAVEAAFDRSPQVQLAYASYRAQIADVDEIKGRRWPQLQFTSRSKAVEFGGEARNMAGRGAALSANVTTSIFDWGYLSKTIKSRQQTADAGKEYYDAQLENSAYTVTTAMAELAKQRQLIKISQQFVDRMQTLVTMLGQIVAVDRGRASELTQAKARLLQAQASHDAVAAKARDTELTLRKLIGERPLNLPSVSAWNIEPASLDVLLSSMDTHPQIRQARAEAEAARLQADAVRVSSRPSINWIVSKTIGRDEIDRSQPFQTMLTLNWNAFQGGSAKAAELAALERARASEQKIEQARLDLEYALRAADEDARTLLKRADLYGDLVGETDRVRKAFFDQWYHLGKRSLLDVLQAENDHYGNRINEITTRFDGYQAVFRELSSAGELIRWMRGVI
ncbi:TolC family protein [Burkholderia orbicola]|uniref:TolC family protein n=1 Tax=Burkholderia orbicola TaxID=2978683 RepID=A0ABT8NY67_9BURK|nr:TolC family protein [Burkholderia orbicola]MDN7526369.1 TolC family protein [Burkholderia orbicola]